MSKTETQDLWSKSVRCECCSGVKYNCTAGAPCENCRSFFWYILERERQKAIEAQIKLLYGILSIRFKTVEDARIWMATLRDTLEEA